MNILVYSKNLFIKNEFLKDSFFANSFFVESFEDLLQNLSNDLVLIHNISDFPEDFEKLVLATQNLNIKLLALTNIPEEIEGIKYLKLGYKSYLHAYSNMDILKTAIDTIHNNNIYVYPKLMNFLISQIPSQNQQPQKELLNQLTKKEHLVLELVAKGMNNISIAKELDIAEVTVKKHISSMFGKLNIKDRVSLALFLKN